MSADGSDAGDEVESDTNGAYANSEALIRRACCRYGSGCTHIHDPSHRERFWHPSAPKLNNEQLKSQFICNECGFATSQLIVLQSHLQRKTAWSNASLVGCRINCLVDSKEWHEGYVLQFHKSGKHFVEFRQVNEKRWLVMKKIAFYILERPVPVSKDGHEFKDDEEDGLAPVENNYVFCEDISLDYTFAQSVLFKIYGNAIQETGHLTKGHTCLTDADRLNAQYVKGSLLYGELLPRGANKAFGSDRLDTGNASVLFDLGMGTGKILIQAFLQFKNLRYIFGIELSSGRYKIAEEALLKMVRLLGEDSYHVQLNPGRFIIVTEVVRIGSEGSGSDGNGGVSGGGSGGVGSGGMSSGGNGSGGSNGNSAPGSNNGSHNNSSSQLHSSADTTEEDTYAERVLHLQCGNMFDVKNIATADIVMMETDIPADQHNKLQVLLGEMKPEARVLTYLDLRRIWQNSNGLFRQVEANRHQADRYPTSWSVQRGHHFYLWSRVGTAPDLYHSNSWLPQLSPAHSTTITNNNTTRTNTINNSAAESAHTTHVRNNLHHNSRNNTNGANNTSNTSSGNTTQRRWLPLRIWTYISGGGSSGSNKKLTKKAVSVAEYEQNINTPPANDRAVIPLNTSNTTKSTNNVNNSATAANNTSTAATSVSTISRAGTGGNANSSVLQTLQIEPLDIPSRNVHNTVNSGVVGSGAVGSSVQSNSVHSVYNASAGSGVGSGVGSVHNSGAHSAPGSGRASPAITNTAYVHNTNITVLSQDSDVQLPSDKLRRKHSSKHNTATTDIHAPYAPTTHSSIAYSTQPNSSYNTHPTTTHTTNTHPTTTHTAVTSSAGTDSVKLKSPRDSKKRGSKARTGAEAGQQDRSENTSPSNVDESPTRLQLVPPTNANTNTTPTTYTTPTSTAVNTTQYTRHSPSPYESPIVYNTPNTHTTSSFNTPHTHSVTNPNASSKVGGNESHTLTSNIPRNTSNTHLQHSAALGAIDGMEYTNTSNTNTANTNNSTLAILSAPEAYSPTSSSPQGGFNSPGALLDAGFNVDVRTTLRGSTPPTGSAGNGVGCGIGGGTGGGIGSGGNSRVVSTSNSPSSSGKVRSSQPKHTSPNTTPSTTISNPNTNTTNTSNTSLEASVWQHTPTRSIDSLVAQDLVRTETITAQASAGARVLVQQANTYESHRAQKSRKKTGGEVASSGSSSVGGAGAGSGASSASAVGGGASSGKARSVRINNTIPVRAVSGTGGSVASNSTGSGIVATTPPRKADHTKSAKKDGCAIS